MAEIDLAALRINPDLIAEWLTPMEAQAIAAASLGIDGWKAGEALLECVKGGQVQVVACSSSSALGEERPVAKGALLVTPDLWNMASYSKTEFWQGRALFILPSGSSLYAPKITLRCFRMRLNPHHVRTEFPAPINAAPKVAPTPAGLRGRPRGGHWEDMLIEMARRIHFGDFKPAKQANLERAMLDWLSENGHPGDESTVRLRASKLFKAMMGEG